MVRTKMKLRKRRVITSGQMKPNPGSAPGILTQNPLHHPTQVYLMAYGVEGYIEHHMEDIQEAESFLSIWPVVWVNVVGLADVNMIEQLGNLFGLDRLSLEDVLDTNHRPKVEFYDHYVFTIIKGGLLADQFESEQISLFLKKNVVIVFQEKPSHNFEQVRDRVRRGTGKIRYCGPDYLYYALLDEVIDRYFPVLDQLNHILGGIEEQIFVPEGRTNTPDQDIIQHIHHAKSDLLLLHRTIWPMSDIIGMLMREDSQLMTKNTRSFLRDCYDHSIQANELSQFYRDTATGLLNTFLAYEGHKTNEIVKVLTMVSSVFIPLNLIAGVYGMNFHNMPELDWHYGYFFAVTLMLVVAFSMLLMFHRMRWIPSGLPTRKKVQIAQIAAEKADAARLRDGGANGAV